MISHCHERRFLTAVTCFGLAFALLLTTPSPVFAWQSVAAKQRYAAALSEWIEDLARQIEELKRLEGLGNVAQGERDFNEAQLAAIEYELTRLNGESGPAADSLQKFIDIEKQRLERLQPLRKLNVVPAISLTHVRSGLHFGLFHMAAYTKKQDQVLQHLNEFVSLSKQEVSVYESAIKTQSVSPCELSVANHQLLFARYLLAKRKNSLPALLPELRRINSRLESDWHAAKDLHQRRLIPLLDAYFMHLFYLESQLLIAAIEGSRESMQDLLEQRIALHERVLDKGRQIGWGPILPVNFQSNLENLLSCSSAFERYLLDRLRKTGEFEYESMLLFGL
ncbi:MAG: hypothetical protein ACE361_11385 [Aureliella sp.]